MENYLEYCGADRKVELNIEFFKLKREYLIPDGTESRMKEII